VEIETSSFVDRLSVASAHAYGEPSLKDACLGGHISI